MKELEINLYTLTRKEDVKRIKVYGEAFYGIDANVLKHYEDDIRTKTLINHAVSSQLAPNGSNFNFIVIGKGFGKLLGIKSNPKRNAERVFENRRQNDIQSKSFSDHMYERFSYHFFVENLKINHEEISLFLQYADMPLKDLSLFLKPEHEFQLIEYLIEKAKIFKTAKRNE